MFLTRRLVILPRLLYPRLRLREKLDELKLRRYERRVRLVRRP